MDASLRTINLEFKLWHRTDKSIMSLILSSLLTEPLAQVVSCRSTFEVRKTLKNIYEYSFTTRVATSSFIYYMQYMLEGLPIEYEVVVIAIYNISDHPAKDYVQNLLMNFDLRLERCQVSERIIPQVHHASLQIGFSGSRHFNPHNFANNYSRNTPKPWNRNQTQ